MRKILLLLLFCSWTLPDYQMFYSHVKQIKKVRVAPMMKESDFFVIFLVDAKRLDYSDTQKIFHTLAKHPSDGSRSRTIGHAWVYLQGRYEGKIVAIEGGLSGELGTYQPKYLDGVLSLSEKRDPNPIRYLWEVQRDGFFQQGNGGHRPTFAAKIDLTQEQFDKMRAFIEDFRYNHYSLVENQCSSFVSQVAKIAGFELECSLTMPIQQQVIVEGKPLRLWSDPRFSKISFSTPDVLERDLVVAVQEGRAEYALNWYSFYKGTSLKQKLEGANETLTNTRRFLSRKGRAVHADAHRMQAVVDVENGSRHSRS